MPVPTRCRTCRLLHPRLAAGLGPSFGGAPQRSCAVLVSVVHVNTGSAREGEGWGWGMSY